MHEKGGLIMTVRERLLAIRLLEKQERSPECIEKLGIKGTMTEESVRKKMEVNHV